MIKFFRKIRYDLMDKNKTGKYLKYAIGEVFLVMIGILLALQINNWNQERLSKKKEHNYVNRLIKDLASDTLMMSRHIETSKEKFEAGMLIDSLIHNRNLYTNEALDVIFKAQAICRMWMPRYNTNTYTDLINTGNFSLISDQLIADNIRGHYTNLPHSWNDTFDKRNAELLRIMIDLIPLKYHVSILAPESMSNIESPETVLNDLEAKEIFKNLIDYPKIEFYIKNVTRGHIYHIRLMERIKKGTVELINDLQAYKHDKIL